MNHEQSENEWSVCLCAFNTIIEVKKNNINMLRLPKAIIDTIADTVVAFG